MNKRQFGKTGLNISQLGFGCMRLPQLSDNPTDIDEKTAIEMIRYGIDQGINYIDTAYPYHGGASEFLVGKALKDGYREKVYLATKYPSWLPNSYEDLEKHLDEQLKKLQVDYIDCYMLHALNRHFFKKLKALDIYRFLEKAKAEGKIKHIGFSFHDNYDTFIEILEDFDWEFCYLQYNYLDHSVQAGYKGLKRAYDKGLGIMIMEPLRGGLLAKNVPEDIEALFLSHDVKKTAASWALEWVLNHKEVRGFLWGMGHIDEVKENLTSCAEMKALSFNCKQAEVIQEAHRLYMTKIKVMCTNCFYCMPCPVGVNIPFMFKFYNEAFLSRDSVQAKANYFRFAESSRPKNCIACGQCEKVCPQQIDIIKKLKEVEGYFEAVK